MPILLANQSPSIYFYLPSLEFFWAIPQLESSSNNQLLPSPGFADLIDATDESGNTALIYASAKAESWVESFISKCIHMQSMSQMFFFLVRWFRFGNDFSVFFFFGWESLLWQRFLFFFPATETQLGRESITHCTSNLQIGAFRGPRIS